MTSLSPRKPRTTARRTPAGGTGLSLACLAALAAGPAGGQPPGRPGPPPAGGVMHFQKPAGGPAPAAAAAQPDPKKEPGPPNKAADVAAFTRTPSREEVFRMRNDAELERWVVDKIREELRKSRDPKKDPAAAEATLRFPRPEEVGGAAAYVPKTGSYPPVRAFYGPTYVAHGRLHFEELNAERYGWDLGYIQPLVSSAYFFRDVLLWPGRAASGCRYGFWDTSAGKCLPGSPTPYYLYPPGLSITGTAFEGAVITGAAFVFP